MTFRSIFIGIKLSNLHAEDFDELIRLILYEDTYLLNGRQRCQIQGIAMGNCAAPPLAILYMHHIECEIIERCNNKIKYWKRYIDDIFFVTTASPEELLHIANSVNKNIQFTLEMADNNKIAFLDTLVIRIENKFLFELFIKPTNSGTCMPFDAWTPIARKKCLIITETLRAKRISSEQLQGNSMNKIRNRFRNNGYPNAFINSVMNSISTASREQPEFKTFIKVQFISEQQKWRIKRLLRRTGLDEVVRLIFTTEKPLAWQFRQCVW